MNSMLSIIAVTAVTISMASAAEPAPANPAAAPAAEKSASAPAKPASAATPASAPANNALAPAKPAAATANNAVAPAKTAAAPANNAAAPAKTAAAPANKAVAVNTSSPSGSAGMSSATQASTEANKAAYRAVVEECMNKGNLALADKYIAKDMVDHDPGNTVGGLDGFKKFVTTWRGAFPDSRLEIESLVGDGDRIMARTRCMGTHTGTFNGIAATNKRFTIEGFDEVLFKNGKAVEHWGVTDQLGMMKQLGVMPGGSPQAQPSSAPAPAKPAAPATNKY
jgi:predicted ester cyclase